jgi:hypothetical protein
MVRSLFMGPNAVFVLFPLPGSRPPFYQPAQNGFTPISNGFAVVFREILATVAHWQRATERALAQAQTDYAVPGRGRCRYFPVIATTGLSFPR